MQARYAEKGEGLAEDEDDEDPEEDPRTADEMAREIWADRGPAPAPGLILLPTYAAEDDLEDEGDEEREDEPHTCPGVRPSPPCPSPSA